MVSFGGFGAQAQRPKLAPPVIPQFLQRVKGSIKIPFLECDWSKFQNRLGLRVHFENTHGGSLM